MKRLVTSSQDKTHFFVNVLKMPGSSSDHGMPFLDNMADRFLPSLDGPCVLPVIVTQQL